MEILHFQYLTQYPSCGKFPAHDSYLLVIIRNSLTTSKRKFWINYRHKYVQENKQKVLEDLSKADEVVKSDEVSL